MSEPRPRVFLTARWFHLAMLNYEIDPRMLAKWIPPGTELDDFGGRTFVSLVGFQFLDTRVLGLPVPFHRNFEEVNLRFYVRREADDELRRGVVFIKEIVPRRAIAWTARWLYNENYIALPMKHVDEVGERADPRVEYAWGTEGRSHRLYVRATGAPFRPPVDSEEAFITEHYWGYSRQRSGGTVEYRVDHRPWRVWQCVNAELDCDVSMVYGGAFAAHLTGAPHSAFLAEGSAVAVHFGKRIF